MTASMIDLPPDQIEYTPSIDLSGKPNAQGTPEGLGGRFVTWLVKYPTNIAGYIPVLGCGIGLCRIIFSILYQGTSFLKFSYDTYKLGFFKARRIYNANIEFAQDHRWRGVMEMIPGWNLVYLPYYDFVYRNIYPDSPDFY